jgi:nucleoid-associated protein YgaU
MADNKGLFGKLFGKKETAKELEDAARKAAEEAKLAAEAAAEKAKREVEVAAENAKRVADAERYKAEGEARRLAAEAEAKAKEAAAWIGEHTVTAEDTLSHVALKFYGKATPPYYKLIYEANKDIIGDNMNIIVPGQVLRIPALPEELK